MEDPMERCIAIEKAMNVRERILFAGNAAREIIARGDPITRNEREWLERVSRECTTIATMAPTTFLYEE